MLSLGLSLTSVAVRGGGGSGAASFLAFVDGVLGQTTDAVVVDLTDMSMVIRDSSTPANSFSGDPNDKLTYATPPTKWLRNAAGVFVSGNTLRAEYDLSGNALGFPFEPTSKNVFLNNRAPATQDITVTAQIYTLSFEGTGSITLSGAHSATLNGTGANERVKLTFTPSAGTLTCTVSGAIDWVQVEAGRWATSPIETAASPVERASDFVSIATTLFRYSATEGTLLVEATNNAPQGYGPVFAALGSAISNKIWLSRSNSSGKQDGFNVRVSSVNVAGLSGTAWEQGETSTFAGTWEENYFLSARDGESRTLDTDGVLPLADKLIFGGDINNGSQGCHLRRLVYIPRRVEPLELSTLTGASGSQILPTNGAWNWYANPRGIVVDGQNAAGAVTWSGDVVLITEDGARIDFLPGYHKDDHTNPALLRRSSDGRIIAHYTGHNTNSYYQRISVNADDLTEWGAQADLTPSFANNTSGCTYPNLVEIADGLFTFFRCTTDAAPFTWHYSSSADNGVTWGAVTHLLTGNRPYTLAVKTGTNRVDVCCNDGHPREFNGNSLYHFYYDGGTWRDSAGNDLGSPPFAPATDLTKVWDGSSVESWGWDVGWDGVNSVPILAFATFPIPASDHRYQYAKWNGTSWDVSEICTAGGPLQPEDNELSKEVYYSGGICIDPDDVNTIYCSRQDGSGIFQIWRGVTADGGATWTMTQLTFDTQWCFRPNKEPGSNVITYMRGTYTNYIDYSTVIEFLAV